MEKILKEKFEGGERRFGHNVEITASFLRHGPADKKTGHLTEEAIEMAKKVGSAKELGGEGEKYLIKTYSSEMERAKETAEEIVKAVNSVRKGRARVRLELGEKAEDIRMPVDALFLPYSEYTKVYKNKEKVGEKIISLHELAQRIADQIQHFVEMSKRLKNDSKADLINVTHIPWIPAFLKEVIGLKINNETDPTKKAVLEERAVAIFSPDAAPAQFSYLEGFKVVIHRDGDEIKLKLKFKDLEFDIQPEEIQHILEN